MSNYIKLIVLALITIVAMIGTNYARDLAYQVHMVLIMLVAGGMFLWTLRRTDEPVVPLPQNEYFDGVVRAGVVAIDLPMSSSTRSRVSGPSQNVPGVPACSFDLVNASGSSSQA